MLNAAMVDVLQDQRVTLAQGQMLIAEYSTGNYTTATQGKIANELRVVGWGEGNAIGSARIAIEALDGSLYEDLGVFSLGYDYFRWIAGGKVAWEGPGWYLSSGYEKNKAAIIATGAIRIRITSLGEPISFGDPFLHTWDNYRLGIILSDGNASVGAGHALSAYVETPEMRAIVPTAIPEPMTMATCGIVLLFVAWRKVYVCDR